MNDMAFAAAVRQAPRRILRCWLRPYSLGHELLLTREANALLFDPSLFNALPKSDRCFAVIRAVQICSRTWAENQVADKWLRLWRWLIRNEDPGSAAQEFREYRNAGSTLPEIKPDKSQDSRELGSPLMARMLAYAGPIFGEAAFDAPLGMVQWMYFAQAEYDGSCKIKNAYELQVEAEIAEIERQYAEEQKEKHASA
jgi:hypothetical protein